MKIRTASIATDAPAITEIFIQSNAEATTVDEVRNGDTFAGFASVSLDLEAQSAYNATTGVTRAYRGRATGLVLKVLAARYARRCGAQRIFTDNDSLNAPILAINRKMGYQSQPGRYKLVLRLGKYE